MFGAREAIVNKITLNYEIHASSHFNAHTI